MARFDQYRYPKLLEISDVIDIPKLGIQIVI